MSYLTFTKPQGELILGEKAWKSHYLWLKDQGYQLRPRYAPDWIPSWNGTNKNYQDCEDGVQLWFGQICDATHIPTGTKVALKWWIKGPYRLEENIHQFLTSEKMLSHPENHCVPLLDVLSPPDENQDVRILVMPLLRPFDSPSFDTFGEALECIRQLFEGLQFMHQHHVAHGDLAMNNFMMDTQDMFPEGFHPQAVSLEVLDYGPMRKPDLSGRATFFTRTQRPPKYYLIDFGLSHHFDANDTCPRVYPVLGADTSVPEFKDMTQRHNPFWTDVYCAGNLVRRYFVDGHPTVKEIYPGYRGFGFLRPLIYDMVQDDPSKRPTMDEVVERFQLIMDNMSSWKLRSRTSWRAADFFEEIVLFFSHWKRRIWFILTRTPAIPRASTSSTS